MSRRGQPFRPKRYVSDERHPFRQTASGFENLISQERSDDFFFSRWLENPDDAAEFLEHGGEERDPLASDPRSGFGVSAVLHLVLLVFMLLEPNLNEFFDLPADQNESVAEVDKKPLVLFLEEPQPEQQAPPVAAVPVPVVPEAQPAPREPPQVADNRLIIPKAMIVPETRPEVMNDLPYSSGNTEEFYTKEEVEDPGTEGTPEEEAPEDVAELGESGEDELDSEGLVEEELGAEVADGGVDSEALGDFLFHTPDLIEEARKQAEAEARRQRQRRPPPPARTRNAVGEGGENGKFTDIRRFLAGAQFHNPDGGLVVNSNNTMYYNDKGANFVPWIRRMLSEVGRIWRAGMPWAANIYNGHVAVGFKVARDGTVLSYQTLVPSGVVGFDNIAVGAIRAADLLPLPPDYPDETFDIIIVFWYNERPYDIFG